jgi:hypothetical protein
MGKKAKLRREIGVQETLAAWRQELLDSQDVELEAVKDELAHALNRTIQLGDENDRLHDEIADLEAVIVNLNRAFFGIQAGGAGGRPQTFYDASDTI